MVMTEKKEISWTAHAVVDDFPKSILAVFLVIFFSVAMGYCFAHPGLGLLSFVIISFSMLPYFLPVKYHIDDTRLTIRFLFFTTVKPLSSFKNFYHNQTGVNLSTFSQSSALDSFRGHYLRFNRNKSEVLEFLKNKIGD